jgi:hypothetical protein
MNYTCLYFSGYTDKRQKMAKGNFSLKNPESIVANFYHSDINSVSNNYPKIK